MGGNSARGQLQLTAATSRKRARPASQHSAVESTPPDRATTTRSDCRSPAALHAAAKAASVRRASRGKTKPRMAVHSSLCSHFFERATVILGAVSGLSSHVTDVSGCRLAGTVAGRMSEGCRRPDARFGTIDLIVGLAITHKCADHLHTRKH
jgi:hypothetical protein